MQKPAQRPAVSRVESKISELSLESCESTTPLKVDRSASMNLELCQPEDTQGNSGTPCPSSGYKFIFIIFVTSEMILTGFVVYLFMKNLDTEAELSSLKQSVKRHETQGNTGTKQFCLPCARILDDKFLKHMVVQGPREMCCFEDFGKFINVIETISRDTLDKELIKANPCNAKRSVHETLRSNSSCTRSPRPSIHLVRGTPQELRHAGPEGKPIPGWDNKEPGRFRHIFSHQNESIKVLEDGHYYVYSQVYFVETFYNDFPNKSPRQVTPFKRVWQAIYKSNDDLPGYEEVVLRTTQTKCWSKDKDFGIHTSYLGAVLSLSAGDRLTVKASNISLVPRDPKSTFFGAFMV